MGIRNRILARPDLAAMRAARDLTGLADALNAEPPLVLRERYVTARTILAECENGADILDALVTAGENVSAVKWALTFLSQDSGLDVGHPTTQGMIDQLAAGGVLSAEQAQSLKSLALQAVFVDRLEVESAMFNPDGSEK